jgi:hypothetical protein
MNCPHLSQNVPDTNKTQWRHQEFQSHPCGIGPFPAWLHGHLDHAGDQVPGPVWLLSWAEAVDHQIDLAVGKVIPVTGARQWAREE